MTLGPLERIAVALETIAAALTGTTPRPTARPQFETQFEWDGDAGTTPATAPLPEPTSEERCGFLIERYTHPLDRVTLIYQASKDGITYNFDAQEAETYAALPDDVFVVAMTARLDAVAAQRVRDGAAPAPIVELPPEADDGDDEWLYADAAREDVADVTADAEPAEPEDDDERRQREWAAQIRASDG